VALSLWRDGQRSAGLDAQLHGWLTITLNDTNGFNGYHGWHQDGPGPVGRFHKAFVLVSKNRSTMRHDPRNHPVAALKTNLAAVPASARYAHNCALLEGDREGESFDNDPWQCTPPGGMQSGDVIFFREDVWHRTQDAVVDRVALIVDIYRVPLRTTPRDTHIDRGSAMVESARSNEESDAFRRMVMNATDQRLVSTVPRPDDARGARRQRRRSL